MTAIVHVGNVLDILPTLEAGSVNCVVTSPPYWGLRDYGVDGQIGLEPTPEAYVATMRRIFANVWRVLRDDGTLWLNLGDSYNAYNGNRGESPSISGSNGGKHPEHGRGLQAPSLKQKDLCGIPWRVALALQADGWYLRSDIIWSKLNPMPESVTDRPTKAHEYLFMLTKRPRYWYDADAIREESTATGGGANFYAERGREWTRTKSDTFERNGGRGHGLDSALTNPAGRNRRTVWTIATQPFKEAHFATMPEKLVEPCVLAGCPAQVCSECGAPWERVKDATESWPTCTCEREEGLYWCPTCDVTERIENLSSGCPVCGETMVPASRTTVPGTVLDPFTGSGTTGAVACRLGRNFVGIELSPEYAEMAERRIAPHRDQMQLAVT